jgi:hypothetical protein
MTGFITHCCKSSLEQYRQTRRAWLWLCTALWLACAGAWAQVPALELTELKIERVDGTIVLTSNVRLELAPAVEEALLKGIAVHFVSDAVVMRERWYWYDRRVAGVSRHYRLAYQPLTRRWRLTIAREAIGSGAINGSLSQQFDSLSEAMSAIRRNFNWKVADAAEIDPDERYTLNYQFRMDSSQLPRPFQITAGGQNDWNLSLSRTIRLPSELGR